MSHTEYLLEGMPEVDRSSTPQPLGLPPYSNPKMYALECSICGDWAGDLILSRTMTEDEMKAAAMAVPNRLCPTHWRKMK